MTVMVSIIPAVLLHHTLCPGVIEMAIIFNCWHRGNTSADGILNFDGTIFCAIVAVGMKKASSFAIAAHSLQCIVAF